MVLTFEDYEKGFFAITTYDVPDDLTLTEVFKVNIKTSELICFVDAAYSNDLHNCHSTTGFVFIFMGGDIIYKLKTQSITDCFSTEVKLIAAYTVAKLTQYLRMLLQQLGYEQTSPTPIYIINFPVLQMINDDPSPTERTRHINIHYFVIYNLRIGGSIIMVHIKVILNPLDN